jgi:hypothetical protein
MFYVQATRIITRKQKNILKYKLIFHYHATYTFKYQTIPNSPPYIQNKKEKL